jgi:hypothetical protein
MKMGTTMIRATLLSAFAIVAVSGNVIAGNLTHEVGLEATVPNVCSFDSGPTNDNTAFSVTDRENSIFTVQIDPASGRVIATNDTLTFANAFCNVSSSFTLTRSGLTTTASAAPGFANQISYTATVNWGSIVAELPQGGANSFSGTFGPQSGDLFLEINVPADGLLVPGVYTDTLTLNIAPPV